MTKHSMERASLLAAGVVIVVLTAGAFWLSYAHLAEVAGQHGLATSPIRQWAWPATLDLFIVGGELLMLRAGLQGRRDGWAIAATAAGSVGSIALNVAGVGGGRASVPLLDYVTAAVPPTAALLAFGLLMRQVHGLVSEPETTPVPVVEIERDTPVSPVAEEVSPTPRPELAPAPASPLVICGGHLEIPTVPPRPRLGTEAARDAIEQAWRDGLSIREAARVSTRGTSQVQRVYARLDEAHGPVPIKGQTEIDLPAAA
ncbi:DUF2637 domain-containing protein [Streptomyces sp. JV181]|uniref:DUF2637 domain-containing protein n=1 Tax=Streptomyces sp. JV181 TaxID=858635 RepID=UPI002E764208|nr:DUF2637 domain-containing protein [Streptomyces sp. JV181]MEE1774587.1 DUF2637 domain-containing protein [Streptomyces sp. JV181]